MSGATGWWRRHFGGRPADRPVVKETALLAVRGVTPRRGQVYLPPGYDPSRPQPYPLLVALDGQTMPQWRLAATLEELVRSLEVDPLRTRYRNRLARDGAHQLGAGPASLDPLAEDVVLQAHL